MERSIDDLTFDINPREIAHYRKDMQPGLVIGQPRALKALQMGCRIAGGGYNIFVSGKPGTGRKTTIGRILSEYSKDGHVLKDIALVYNFSDPQHPEVLYLEPGSAKKLKKRVHQLIETMKSFIKDKLEGEPYAGRKNAILTGAEQEENRRIQEFEEKLKNRNLKMVQIEEGEAGSTDLVPMIENEPVSFEELQEQARQGSFPEKEWNHLRETYYQALDEMRQVFRELRSARSAVEEKVSQLQREILKPEIAHEVDSIRSSFDNPAVQEYLSALEADILSNLYIFTSDPSLTDETGSRAFVRYGVNILLDHSSSKTLPVIFESRPDTERLLGTVEYRIDRDSVAGTNFMMIRSGSLIAASGGFLVIEAEDILNDEEAWHTLKHSLKTGHAEILPPKTSFNLPVPAPQPRPINIDVKVILIGGEGLYDYLYAQDLDFRKLFKIPAEFNDTMERNTASTIEYLSYIAGFLESENLGPLDDKAAARVIAYGAELAEDREKLTTQFFRISDLLTEARYWADRDNKKSIDRDVVQKAINERQYLLNLPEEQVFEEISNTTILLEMEGLRVGRLNGLAVRSRGSYTFGIPVAISCSVSPGEKGIVNIEREAGLSGEIYNKWILILEGLLRSRFSVSFPLSMYAGICFEQSYGPIDGDSASAAEACVLISSLSGIPLRQDLAVTGSINQNGDLQPVGGISEKIRGFFKACSLRGLTGSQGVVIPEKNMRNVFLDDSLFSAVQKKTFHIYTVNTIDELIELLTGKNIGKRDENGVYPENCIGFLVEKALKEMAERVKYYSQ